MTMFASDTYNGFTEAGTSLGTFLNSVTDQLDTVETETSAESNNQNSPVPTRDSFLPLDDSKQSQSAESQPGSEPQISVDSNNDGLGKDGKGSYDLSQNTEYLINGFDTTNQTIRDLPVSKLSGPLAVWSMIEFNTEYDTDLSQIANDLGTDSEVGTYAAVIPEVLNQYNQEHPSARTFSYTLYMEDYNDQSTVQYNLFRDKVRKNLTLNGKPVLLIAYSPGTTESHYMIIYGGNITGDDFDVYIYDPTAEDDHYTVRLGELYTRMNHSDLCTFVY